MSRSEFSKPPQPRSVQDFVGGATSQVQLGSSGDSMGYVRINVQITPEQQEKLRHMAFARRVSQAELVRLALGDWLRQQT